MHAARKTQKKIR